MIQTITILILIYTTTIFVHEIGHLLSFAQINKEVLIRVGKQEGKFRIVTGEEKDYKKLNKEQLKNIYYTGIGVGLLWLIIMARIFQDLLIYIAILTFYYVWFGCKTDFELIKGLKCSSIKED